jgi:AcrR family transcriptional regulator
MGRPREHDDRTAAALLAAAERIVQADGVETLSVRGVAAEVGTTTRAVYSLFGSKDGLVSALGVQAFELLRQGLEALPASDDPRADLVEAGLMFRRFAIEHPSLFAIGIQHAPASPAVRRTGSEARDVLKGRIRRLADAGRLGGRTVDDGTLQFHALCEGLAMLELRGTYPEPVGERMWREGLGALVAGFGADQPATVSHSS